MTVDHVIIAYQLPGNEIVRKRIKSDFLPSLNMRACQFMVLIDRQSGYVWEVVLVLKTGEHFPRSRARWEKESGHDECRSLAYGEQYG